MSIIKSKKTQIELSENDVDRITGCRIIPSDNGIFGEENVVVVSQEHLRNLVKRLNTCEGLNPQEELDKLCEYL